MSSAPCPLSLPVSVTHPPPAISPTFLGPFLRSHTSAVRSSILLIRIHHQLILFSAAAEKVYTYVHFISEDTCMYMCMYYYTYCVYVYTRRAEAQFVHYDSSAFITRSGRKSYTSNKFKLKTIKKESGCLGTYFMLRTWWDTSIRRKSSISARRKWESRGLSGKTHSHRLQMK